jgi:hypothetical protein
MPPYPFASLNSTKKNCPYILPSFLIIARLILIHKTENKLKKTEVIMKALKVSLEMALFIMYPVFVLIIVALSLL